MAGVTGHSYPKFDIYLGNTFIEQIELNLCDPDGLLEEYEFFGIKHTLINYSEETFWKGFHINFTLSYKEYSDHTNSIKIQKLIDYSLKNYRIIIIPRADHSFRYFEVNYAGDSLSLGILKGGTKSIGNKEIELKFRTKALQTDMKWIDPDNVTAVFDDFITTI